MHYANESPYKYSCTTVCVWVVKPINVSVCVHVHSLHLIILVASPGLGVYLSVC